MQASYKIVLIASLIGVLPVFGWFWMIVKKNNWGPRKVELFLRVFFWGVFSVALAGMIEIYFFETGKTDLFVNFFNQFFLVNNEGKLVTDLSGIFFISLAEEISKGLAIGYSIFKFKMEKLTEGLIFGMIVGLAFGATENGVYFVGGLKSQQTVIFGGIVILRFLLSTSAHIIYSGLMGLIMTEIVKVKSFASKSFVVFLSLLVPFAFHSVFNFLLDSNFNFLIVFVILLGFALLYFGYRLNEQDDEEALQIN